MEGHCGKCKFAQESAAAGMVECRFNPPGSIVLQTSQGAPVMVGSWPIVKADDGWCKNYEAGEPVKLSKIIKPRLVLDTKDLKN